MHQDLPRLVEDANLHRPGVEIDPTGCFMLFGGEAPEVSSASVACSLSTSIPPWYAEEGASISITALELTGPHKRPIMRASVIVTTLDKNLYALP
jgi:hypothetical protein